MLSNGNSAFPSAYAGLLSWSHCVGKGLPRKNLDCVPMQRRLSVRERAGEGETAGHCSAHSVFVKPTERKRRGKTWTTGDLARRENTLSAGHCLILCLKQSHHILGTKIQWDNCKHSFTFRKLRRKMKRETFLTRAGRAIYCY